MKKIIILLFLSVSLFSCEKISVGEPEPIDLLTNGLFKSWKLTYYKQNEKDLLAPCLQDDVFVFWKSTKEYQWKTGNVLCNPADKEQIFKFELSEDNQILKVNGVDYKIVSLSQTKLEISTKISETTFSLGYEAIK